MSNVCTMCLTFFCDGTTDNSGLLALNKKLLKAVELGNGRAKLIDLLSDATKEGVADLRGKLVQVDVVSPDAQEFRAMAETAWSPNHELITALCSAYENISYASASDEACEDIFEIYNDPDGKYYPFEYQIDIWGNEEIPEICEFLKQEDETLEILKENLGHLCDGESLEDFEEFLDDEDIGRIRHWYHMEPSDYNLDMVSSKSA